MAPFNRDINPSGDPSYLSLSKETDKPFSLPAREGRPVTPVAPAAPAAPAAMVTNVANTTVDSTFETLFKNLAQGVKLGADAIDAGVQNDIWKQLNEKYRAIQNNEFAVGDATDFAGRRIPPTDAQGDNSAGYSPGATDPTTGEPLSILPKRSQGKGLPPGAQGIVDNMKQNDALYKSGQLSESYYLGVMNAEMAKVITAYPSYEKEIREMTKGIIGVDTSNALRKSLQADYGAREQALRSSQSTELKEIQTHQKYLPATAQQDWATGKTSIWEIRKIYGQRMSREFDRDQEKAERTNDQEEKEYKTRRVFSNEARDVVTTIMNNKTISPEANAIIQRWKTPNYQPTPTEMETVQLSLAETEKKINMSLDALSKGIDPHTGELRLDAANGSPSTYLKRDEIEGIKQQAKTQFEIYKSYVGIKDMSLAGRFAEMTLRMEDKRMLDFQRDFPTIARWGTINKNAGPNMAGIVIGRDDTLLGPLLGDMRKYMHMDTVGTPNPAPQSEQIKKALPHIETPTNKAKFIKEDVDKNADVLSGREKNADDLYVKQLGMSVFHPQNNIFSLIAPADYTTVYSKYTSPSVSLRIAAINDPNLNNRYETWATEKLPVAIQDDMRMIQRQWKSDGRFTIEMNPDSHLLVVKTAEPTSKIQRNTNPMNRDVDMAVQRVNSNISNLTRILENGKRDIDGTMENVFAGMGITFDTQKGKEAAPKGDKGTTKEEPVTKLNMNFEPRNLSPQDWATSLERTPTVPSKPKENIDHGNIATNVVSMGNWEDLPKDMTVHEFMKRYQNR